MILTRHEIEVFCSRASDKGFSLVESRFVTTDDPHVPFQKLMFHVNVYKNDAEVAELQRQLIVKKKKTGGKK